MTERKNPDLTRSKRVEPANPELLDKAAEAFKSAISNFNADEIAKLSHALSNEQEVIISRAVLRGLSHNQDIITPPKSGLGQ